MAGVRRKKEIRSGRRKYGTKAIFQAFGLRNRNR
jgi:hypothetical protein